MLRTVALAITKKIPEEIRVDASISQRVRLVGPIQSNKQLVAVIKTESNLAMNPNPSFLPYRVQILNNKAERALRQDFAKAICSQIAGTPKHVQNEVVKRAGELAAARELEYLQNMAD